MQRVHNRAARVITLSPMSIHITPIFTELHWLPVRMRIQFRILVFVFKLLHNMAPGYLCDMVNIYVPGRQLRSSSDTLKLVSKLSRRKVDLQAFSIQAPLLWNLLPLGIRGQLTLAAFKRSVKTHFFTEFIRLQ